MTTQDIETKVKDLMTRHAAVLQKKATLSGQLQAKREELADLMEAAVAGSRPAVDLEWVPYERQIGLTGKKVSPRLLLASGISGAFEFVAGIKDAHFVVAINRDSTAPIFKVADLGIIGDHHQILPALNDALRRMKR